MIEQYEFDKAKNMLNIYRDDLYYYLSDRYEEEYIQEYFEEHNVRALTPEQWKFGCKELDYAEKYAEDCINGLIDDCFYFKNYIDNEKNFLIIEYLLNKDNNS